jgi:NTE family protein
MAGKELLADLVLEGGGVKGIGLAGAITVLENHGYKFERTAGTSAGAIVAAFVAAGISADEITAQMRTIDYKQFRDETFLSNFGPVGKVFSLLINNGIYKGSYIKNWLEARLAEYGVHTFADLKLRSDEFTDLPVEKAYKLVVVTADITKGELVYLPWDFHKYGLNPDEQSVAAAVRASISIPYFYKPAHLGKSTLVDGGVLSNFPIGIFDTPESGDSRWPTFGIKLSAKADSLQVAHKVTGPLSLAEALVATATSGHDERHLDDPCTLKRTMFVDTAKIQATNFDISRAQQDLLFNNGQKAAREFLQTWNFASYKRTCR